MHVAIIMDGNGRWAARRGLPRIAGHRKGAESVRHAVESSPALGISTLTLYAFSSDNWKRPSAEVRALMQLFRLHLDAETDRCRSEGVRISVIGRRDRLPASLIRRITSAEEATANGTVLHLRLAVDYSAREAIAGGKVGPDVDLLIRTGGEQRLSDFLLWECAYAELRFDPCMWPDFRARELRESVAWFHARERRFGGLPGLGQLGSHDAQTGNVHHVRGDRWLR